MNPLLTLSASELARRIRAREVSPVEAVEAHLERIEAVNPLLNAVVVPRFNEARREAKWAEEVRDRTPPGALPPLFGVPMTVKECFAVAGMPWTGAVAARRGVVAREDATVVRRLRDAGAIVLGLTNTSEGLIWCESRNPVYGKTRNPRDLGRTPGGSSGGEAAILAAAGSALGVGSDVGGSIRVPAAWCGVVGHKPTGALVPQTGHYPPPRGETHRFNACGPLGRRVRDLRLAMTVLAGADGRDPSVADGARFAEAAADPARVRVTLVEDVGLVPCGGETRRALRRAADALADAGFRVERRRRRELARAFDLWSALMTESGGWSVAETITGGGSLDLPRAWVRTLAGRRDAHMLQSLYCATMEAIGARFPAGFAQGLAADARALRDRLAAELGAGGVVLAPVLPVPATPHGVSVFGFFAIPYPALWNVFGFPATAVPAGETQAGLPLGVQIVGAPMRDGLTLSVAERIEEALGGWRPARVAGADA